MKVYMVGNKTAILAFECKKDAQDFISSQSVTIGLEMWAMNVIPKVNSKAVKIVEK
jgi:hypothetical protein